MSSRDWTNTLAAASTCCVFAQESHSRLIYKRSNFSTQNTKSDHSCSSTGNPNPDNLLCRCLCHSVSLLGAKSTVLEMPEAFFSRAVRAASADVLECGDMTVVHFQNIFMPWLAEKPSIKKTRKTSFFFKIECDCSNNNTFSFVHAHTHTTLNHFTLKWH